MSNSTEGHATDTLPTVEPGSGASESIPRRQSVLARAWRGFVNTTEWGEQTEEEKREAEKKEAERHEAEQRAAARHASTATTLAGSSSSSSSTNEKKSKSNPNTAQKAWQGFLNTTQFGEESDDENPKTHKGRKALRERTRAVDSDSTSSGEDEEKLAHVDTSHTTFSQVQLANDGRLYRDGELVLQPAPTKDPRDPLNLTTSRKVIACFFLCFFGALAASAELILGSMLPVFALQYAGIDPKLLEPLTANLHGFPQGVDPLKTLENLPNGQPIWKIYLLASLPVLMIGISNLALIPIAISVGRRPVVLITGVIAIVGAIWAGFSGSLGSHLGARCVQALGAGTVESLIPFIIQDIVHVHERNTWISGVFAAQGMIIIALGIASPYMIINLSWRYVYYITAALAGFFLIGVFFFLPETRWRRSASEMNGTARDDSGKSFQVSLSLSSLQHLTARPN